VDWLAEGSSDAVLLLSRLLLGIIFVHSAIGKILDLPGFVAGLEKFGLPMSWALAEPSPL
jgi:uncharacterized membrane protein YphA (DoxX/SURF4 family)